MQERKPLLRRMLERIRIRKRVTEPAPSERLALSEKEQERLNEKLREAAKEGNNAEIERLIKAGADITAEDNNWFTSLYLAALNGHTGTCALLLSKYETAGGDMKILIEERASIEKKESEGFTALHYAIDSENTGTCALVLSKYEEARGDVKELIEKKDSGGRTALHRAASKGQIGNYDLLLSRYENAGGDVKKLIEEKNRDGWTVLQQAAYYSVIGLHGHADTCAFLLARYADAGGDVKRLLFMADNGSKTAAMLATYPKRKSKTTAFLESVESLSGMMEESKTVMAFLSDFNRCVSG